MGSSHFKTELCLQASNSNKQLSVTKINPTTSAPLLLLSGKCETLDCVGSIGTAFRWEGVCVCVREREREREMSIV